MGIKGNGMMYKMGITEINENNFKYKNVGTNIFDK